MSVIQGLQRDQVRYAPRVTVEQTGGQVNDRQTNIDCEVEPKSWISQPRVTEQTAAGDAASVGVSERTS